jgi:glycosyltransferase involved in cell wall biosynthesis
LPGKKLWTLVTLARELRLNPPDYFFTSGYFIPRSAPRLSFAVIHDVLFRKEPGKYSGKERLWQSLVTRWNMQRAAHLFTVSQSSLEDIQHYYGVAASKISLAPVGHDAWDNLDLTQSREPWLVYIGRLEKKKSVDLLVRAFLELSGQHPTWRLKLVGKPGFGYEEITALVKASGLAERIEFLGYVTEEAKKELLTCASLFIHPSSSEGSSIPVLEAWDAQVPAVVAQVPAMTSLGAEAATYFKPGDQASLVDAIEKVMSQPDLRSKLIEAGKLRLKLFGWSQTAQAIIKGIEAAKS